VSRANALHDFVVLFLWDAWVVNDNVLTSLMNLEFGVMPFLEEVLVIVSFIFDGGIDAYIEVRNTTMDM